MLAALDLITSAAGAVRRHWRPLAAGLVLAATFRGGCVVQARVDAGDIAGMRTERDAALTAAKRGAATARAWRTATAEARAVVARLSTIIARTNREVDAARDRSAALDRAYAAVAAELAARHQAERDRPPAAPYPEDCRAAVDVLILRALTAAAAREPEAP